MFVSGKSNSVPKTGSVNGTPTKKSRQMVDNQQAKYKRKSPSGYGRGPSDTDSALGLVTMQCSLLHSSYRQIYGILSKNQILRSDLYCSRESILTRVRSISRRIWSQSISSSSFRAASTPCSASLRIASQSISSSSGRIRFRSTSSGRDAS